ncbi:MAG: RHS repeat protein [Rhodothermia bacterium]|nr:RHS repeat protein [Rhodothermia bacterium]
MKRFLISRLCLVVLCVGLAIPAVKAQSTAYSLNTSSLCNTYNVAGTVVRLKVDMFISGSTLSYEVRKMSSASVCSNASAVAFASGTMSLWDTAQVQSVPYNGISVVTGRYSLSFTSGSRSYYIKNYGLDYPNFSVGPFTVTATTLSPNISLQTALSVSPTSANTGQNVTASFTLRNTGNAAGTILRMTVAIIKDDILVAEYDPIDNQTIAAGGSYTYSRTRTFSTTGTFSLEARWQTSNGWTGEKQFRTLTISAPPLSINGGQASPNSGAIQNVTKHTFFATVSGGITGVPYQVFVDFTRPNGSSSTLPMSEIPADFPNTFGVSNQFDLSGTYSYRYRVTQTGGATATTGTWSIYVAPAAANISLARGLVISPNSATQGQEVTVDFAIQNTGNITGNVSNVTVAIIKDNVRVDDYIHDQNVNISPNTSYTFRKARAFSTSGDFTLQARWQINGAWFQENIYKPLTVNSPATSNLEMAGAMSISPNPLLRGQGWNYSVQIRNPGNTAWSGKVRLALLDASNTPINIVHDIGNGWDTVNLGAGASQTLAFTKTTITSAAGAYKLRLDYEKTGTTGFVNLPQAAFVNPVSITIQEPTSICATIDNDPLFANGANAPWKEAALFLIQRNIVACPVSGSTIQANQPIVRQDLAKILYVGLWGSLTAASPTDNFPSPYTDLQDATTGYHRYAKALLYLEYGDGISPFTRNRTHFYPVANIPRQYALKVLLEGWRIAPSASVSTPPFNDVPLTTDMVRYIDRAKTLGFVQGNNGNFEPNSNMMRGDAFIVLKRMIESTTVTKPTTADLNNISNYFVPNNITPKTMHSAPDLALGNFSTYAKSAFNIPDIGFALSFDMEYNSSSTELPEEWTLFEPLGKGWSHNYMAYIGHSLGDEANSNADDRYVVNWGGVAMNSYKTSTLQSETEGIYDQLAVNGTTATLTAQDKTVYTFQRLDGGTNPFWISSIRDRNNNTLTFNYSSTPISKTIGGRTVQLRLLSEVVVPSGRKLTFSYQNNKLIRVTDPVNRQVNIGYNAATGQLETFTDAKSNVTTYGYGQGLESYLLKSVKLPEGNVINTEYDLNRKAKSIASNGETTTINLQPQYNDPTTFLKSTVTEKVDGKTTTYTTEYFKNNSLKNYAGPNGHNVGLAYNHATDKTLPTTITDSRDGTTTVGYNSKGNPTTSSWNGLTATIVYQDEVFPREIIDPNGNTTTITYDARFNPEKVTDAEGNATITTYFPNGLPQNITNPEGITTALTYNQYGNVETVTLPEGISSRTDYDGASRPNKFTNPLGQALNRSYDPNDNVEREEFGGAATTFGYDKNDNLRWIKDPLQQTTTLNYDALDRLREQIFNGKTRSWTFLDGVLKTYTSPNGKTFTYEYDTEGRPISDGYATNGYNADGTLQSITKDGKSITIGYDAQKRPTSVSYDGQTVGYTYDNNGNVLTITYPGNKIVRYTYYRNNWLKTVTDWNNKTTTYTYYRDGRLKTETLPNGVVTTYSYNTAGQNTGISIAKPGSPAIATYTFGLDKLGQHTSVTANEPLGAEPPLTNLTQTATYTNNVMSNLNGATVNHNNNGAMTQDGSLQVSYDDKDMPLSISGNGLNAQHTYDGLKIRRSKTDNGVLTKYVVDILGIGDVLMETDANNSPKAYYIHGLGLIARIKADGTTTHYYHGDYRGSVIALSDANAALTHKYQYGPFGEVAQRQEPANDSQPFLYVGKEGVQYEGNNMHYMRNRYYNANNGRFLSEDPIWHANLYPYADNNPIMGIDPDGLETSSFGSFKHNFYKANPNLKGKVELHHIIPQRYDKYISKKIINSSYNIIPLSPLEHSAIDSYRYAKGYKSLSVLKKGKLKIIASAKIIGKIAGPISTANKIKNGLMPLYYTLTGKDAIDEKVKEIDSYVPDIVKQKIHTWGVESGLKDYLIKNGIVYKIPK